MTSNTAATGTARAPRAGASARCRHALVTAAVVGVVACGRRSATPAPISLLQLLNGAERRPAAAHIAPGIATLGGATRPAIEVPPNSRIVWTLRLPDHAVLDTAVGMNATAGQAVSGSFRIGIADERTYEELAAVSVDGSAGGDAAWTPVHVDLGAYSGFKWSLFYHPRSKVWKIIFNTSARARGPSDRLWWAEPIIHDGRAR